MASGVTLADLKARALDYADMTGSGFPVTLRLVDYINDGLAILHDLLIATGAGYYGSSQSISVVAGTAAYALPTNYYKTLKVYLSDGGRLYRVPRADLDAVSGLRSTPSSAATMLHIYATTFTRLSGDSDTIEAVLPNGWEDYVALHAAIRLLMREESDPSALMRERDQRLQVIMAAATPRDDGEPASIQDVSRRWEPAEHLLMAEGHHFVYTIGGGEINFYQNDFLGAA